MSLKYGSMVLPEDTMKPATILLSHLNLGTYNPTNPPLLKFLLLYVFCLFWWKWGKQFAYLWRSIWKVYRNYTLGALEPLSCKSLVKRWRWKKLIQNKRDNKGTQKRLVKETTDWQIFYKESSIVAPKKMILQYQIFLCNRAGSMDNLNLILLSSALYCVLIPTVDLEKAAWRNNRRAFFFSVLSDQKRL